MDKVTEKILNILTEELVPAEGCTEPIAIAYAAAKLTNVLGNVPEKIDAYLSGNIVKMLKVLKYLIQRVWLELKLLLLWELF